MKKLNTTEETLDKLANIANESLKESLEIINKKKRFGRGTLKGKMKMSDDFNEPLEDMKEYM